MSKILIACIASLIVLLVIGGILPTSTSNTENVKTQENFRAYTSHKPIRINNDTELDAIAQQEGWSGTGGYLSPYIIENYEIDGNGSTAFYVGNTTEYFIIRYSHLFNSSNTAKYFTGAIEFYKVKNGYVTGCNITDSVYGVYVSTHSTDIQVTYSDFWGVGNGVYLYFYTSSSTISHNNFHYSTHVGYAVTISYSSNDNEVWYNTMDGPRYGMYINGQSGATTGNKISRNTMSNLGSYGVYAYYTLGENRIENNTIAGSNEEGIRVYSRADNTIIVNNSIRNCIRYGIDIHLSDNVLVYNNSLANNNGATDTYNSAHVQAVNNGTENMWYYNGYGNYWADWTTPDSDGDGIVDNPYILDGDSGSQDSYPLAEPSVPIPELSWILPLISALFVIAVFRKSN